MIEEGERRVNILERSEKAAFKTTIGTFFLAVGKGVAGLLTGSLVLLTDALHSAADIFPILASWFGLRISQRDPDEKFPWGYYKAESLATLFVSIFILYFAIELIVEGYSRIFTVSKILRPVLAGVVALTSIIGSGIIAWYQNKVGEETGSQALVVNSRESLADVLSSGIVFVAIALSYYQTPYVEGIATIIIALFVLKTGLESIKYSIYALMDISPGEEVRERLEDVIESYPEIEDYRDLKCRKSGPFVFGEVKVEIGKSMDIDKAHRIIDGLEEKIKAEVENLEYFTTHFEPYEPKEMRITVPVSVDENLDSSVSSHFGRANYFVFVNLSKDEGIRDFEVRENQFKDKEVRAGHSASHFMVEENVDTVITREIGEISFHTLRDHFVNVYEAKGESVREVIDSYLSGDLERFSNPTKHKD